METSKSKLMQFALDSTRMESSQLTAKNLLDVYFTQFTWEPRIGGWFGF